MSDERKGLPSASKMYRDAGCSGNRILTASLKEQGFIREGQGGWKPDKDCQEGLDIHASLVPGSEVALSKSAQETRDECDRIACSVVDEFFGRVVPIIIAERRFWYTIGETRFFSGQPDRVYINSERILDINFKSGRGDEEDAHLNLQLRTEVVLLKHAYPNVKEIGAAIVQPWVTHKPEIVVYDEDAMQDALVEILEIVDRTHWVKRRTAGPWCRYCPARAFCPEAKTLAIKYPYSVNVEALPVGQEGADVLEKVMIADKLLKSLKEAYTKRVEVDPGCIPGWHIKIKSVRQWKDTLRAIETAKAYCGDDAVDAILELPFGKAEELCETGKHTFDALFSDLIEYTQTKGTLSKMPKRLRK